MHGGDARVADGVVRLWYGDAHDPDAVLAPIPMAELERDAPDPLPPPREVPPAARHAIDLLVAWVHDGRGDADLVIDAWRAAPRPSAGEAWYGLDVGALPPEARVRWDALDARLRERYGPPNAPPPPGTPPA